MTAKPSPEHLRLLHLGDSYTCAEGIDPAHGWPALLAAKLEARGITIHEQRLIAQTGWITGKLAGALEQADPGTGWDLVTLCIGVNDQYRGLPVEDFSRDLSALIRRTREYAKGGALGLHLLSIPDWSPSPFAEGRDRAKITGQVDAFNATIAGLAAGKDLPFHDWTGLSRQLALRPDAFAPDGLHPSESQHRAWADWLADKLFRQF